MAARQLNRERGLIATVIAAAALLAPAAASATTIPVNSTLDTTGGGICTLRDAINAANGNTIFGTCPAGQASPADTIDLSGAGGPQITLTSALPAITSDLNIVGPGSGQLTVDGATLYRPFRTTSSSLTDSISGLTVAHGFCDATCVNGPGGAGIYNAGTLTLSDVTVTASTASETGGTAAFPEGGGILNQHTLHLVLSTVSNNTATATSATSQNGPDGGGIWNNGTLTIDRSTVSGNQAVANAGGVGTSSVANGGGIDHFTGSLTVSQSTISGNSATATGATGANNAHGGGIGMANTNNITLTLDRSTVTGNSVSAGSPTGSQGGAGIDGNGSTGSSVTLVSSTISGNSAPAGGSNLAPAGATRSIKNTIVSNPLGGSVNCTSTNTGSLGFNISDTAGCGFTLPGDQQGTGPMLDVLAPNGGPTQTMALLTGSPAIDAGLSSVGETADQRGMTRPLDLAAVSNAPASDGTDIGAFEVQGPAVTPPSGGGSAIIPPAIPDTSLGAKVRKRKRKATFTFGSADPGASFMCKLDKRPFSPCSPPITFKHLRTGRHTFMVEALNAAGTDPSPATFSFKLKP